MKRIRFTILAFLMLMFAFATAQTRGVAKNAIPGDNNIRYYRLALPVTVSAYQQDLGSDYNNVLRFWRECEDYANRMFVPLGICFDVVEDSRLVMSQPNMIDENIYLTAQTYGWRTPRIHARNATHYCSHCRDPAGKPTQ